MIMRILLALLVAMTLYVPAALADEFIAVGPISNGSAIFRNSDCLAIATLYIVLLPSSALSLSLVSIPILKSIAPCDSFFAPSLFLSPRVPQSC